MCPGELRRVRGPAADRGEHRWRDRAGLTAGCTHSSKVSTGVVGGKLKLGVCVNTPRRQGAEDPTDPQSHTHNERTWNERGLRLQVQQAVSFPPLKLPGTPKGERGVKTRGRRAKITPTFIIAVRLYFPRKFRNVRTLRHKRQLVTEYIRGSGDYTGCRGPEMSKAVSRTYPYA